MAFLDPIFNPLLGSLINLNPFWGILVISLFISLIVVLVYKFFTNQDEMKRLKEQQKEYQTKIKSIKDKPEELMKMQKEAMSKNFEYMKHSFKATLITMLPIILIFGWMNAHLSYEPIFPDETYSVTAKFKESVTGAAQLSVDEGTELLSAANQTIAAGIASWSLKSNQGEHQVTVHAGGQEQSKKITITRELKYEPAVSLYQHSDIASLQINYNKLRPLGQFSLFGWQPGWLGWYIIFSIVFSIILRKVMKVY